MKKLGLGPKMILSFLVAIAGSVVICGVITYSRTKNVLNSNMQLTSEQTLESALNSLQTYEKTISLPVDLLTRKTSIKQLEYEDQFDDYIANVQDELVAACKVTQGAVRSYYATSSGKLITGWVKYEDNGDKTAMNTIEENVDLSGEDWYVNCQGRKAKVNSIFSYITQPYEDPQTGGQIFTVAQEVKYKDVLMGVVAMDIDAAQLENYIRNIRILNTGFAMLIDADGNIVLNGDVTFGDGFPDAKTLKTELKDDLLTITGENGFEMRLDVSGTLNGAQTGTTVQDLKINATGIGAMRLQIGANEHQVLEVNIPAVSLQNMGIENVDVSTAEGADDAIDRVDGAIKYVSSVRGRLGAFQNRLESTINSLDITSENMTSAYSRIMDVDMAEEMTSYTTYQILAQAGTSMLAQANERPSQVLQLLQ